MSVGGYFNYYLINNLDNDTTINGGLLTTSVIKLGGSGGEKAGISGVSTSSVSAWFGGTYDDALRNPGQVGCIFSPDGSGQLAKGNITWDNSGKLTMIHGEIDQKVTVKGSLLATSGTIGGFNISPTAIQAKQEGKTRLLIDTGDIPPQKPVEYRGQRFVSALFIC